MNPDKDPLDRPQRTQDGRAPRTLVVEDHADSARVLMRLLELDGHHVTLAASYAAALAAAAAQRFDLLIADITLPDGDGCDLCAAIQPCLEGHAIAMTGHGSPEDLERCREAGFQHHILKPFDFATLRRVIAEALAG